MACPNPLKGFMGSTGGIVFSKAQSPTKVKMEVPCGQCWSCRLARSREWATRLVKEAMYWKEEERMFLTLTYNNENLPKDGSLELDDFQNFMKALRFHFSTIPDGQKRQFKKIKYFHCGEYGQVCKNCGLSYPFHQESQSGKTYTGCNTFTKGLGRPHYHAIIFGVTFNDLTEFKKTSAGELIYKSKTLDGLWKKGFCSVGTVTFESCAYVSRYIMKKITGDNSKEHYQKSHTSPDTGEVTLHPVKPEYITMSRNPAIAKEYMNDNMLDIFKNDGLLLKRQGQAFITKPPRYYLKQLEKVDPLKLEILKEQRRQAKRENKAENTDERNAVKERIKKIKTKTLTRQFEDYHNAN